MSNLDYIYDREKFTTLWSRATAGVQSLVGKSRDELLYFDPIDIATQKFFELIRTLLTFEGKTEFATVILKPDPFNYFHHHFGKYPGFIHGSENTDDEYFSFLMKNPGDNIADALGVNHEHYVIMPLVGNWIAFGDRSWDTGVFYGPPDIMECAKDFYPFFIAPLEQFQVEP
ncbi:hypothetical protein PQR14_16145 [Paraburkholderia bryophila]|uniref:hypothetical protein n=1 Tax=Burkholderiaceae TaxID=119060 RepID=UPI00055334DF|nr:MULTISPECIES: hypothetical protein [Burkholderiaceae]